MFGNWSMGRGLTGLVPLSRLGAGGEGAPRGHGGGWKKPTSAADNLCQPELSTAIQT